MIAVKMVWYHKQFEAFPGSAHLKKSVVRKPPFRKFTEKDYSVICPMKNKYPLDFKLLCAGRMSLFGGEYCYKCNRYKGIIFPGQARCAIDEMKEVNHELPD